MNSPLISVIVPVYNAEGTLRQCVDSILGQGNKDFELLLVNDGSNDNSPAICDEYSQKDNRVKVFHKPNGGVSSARNLALDVAQGRWICFIDSDDYITENYFDITSGNSDDILIKGYKTFDDIEIVDFFNLSSIPKTSNISFFITYCFSYSILLRGPVFKFYKRDIIGDLRFLTDMVIGEDANFVFKYMAKCKSFKLLDEGAYMIRKNEKPYEIRYSMDVKSAANSLNHLYDAFSSLNAVHRINPSLFLPYLSFFKLLSKEDWCQHPQKWYKDPIVKRLYKQIWPFLSCKQRVSLLITKYYNLCTCK